jgi:glycosyltransferase involved in cell wall biosynthesis
VNTKKLVNEVDAIAIVSAVPETMITFMSNHLRALSGMYSVSAICGDPISIPSEKLVPNVEFIDLSIERKISPFKDLISLFKLIHFFRSHDFTLVQSITPKAGLLSMLAAWICRVPIRVHVFTGQVWVTRSGFSRWYLKSFDRLIAILATSLLADSPSQKQFLVDEGITSVLNIQVLADGSICGVDTSRFKPNAEVKKNIRAQLGIPEEAVVALFMGRLKRDKGVLDLASAFGGLEPSFSSLYLIFVGPDEDGLREQILHLASLGRNQVRFSGHVNNPEDFIAAADFLCLPSYREGFGLVTIEAAAVGIPTLASRIYGITDAIIDGVTGLLHEPGDLAGIAEGLRVMTAISETRISMGDAAQKRALELFTTSRIVNAQLSYYKSLIQKYRNHA